MSAPSYAREREDFILAMQAEGMHPDVARRLLRHANTYQRLAELACSSEAADRDQVRCPEPQTNGQCLCRDYGSFDASESRHGTVPRYMVQQARIERLARKLCTTAGEYETRDHKGLIVTVPRFAPVFSGDPRGACLKLTVPSGRTDDGGRTGLCVPTRWR